MTAIEWQLFIMTALGYGHSDEVLIHQQQHWCNSRQRNSSDINFIPHNEHRYIFVFAYSLCDLGYKKDCIGLVQLPSTKTKTIILAIRDKI